jgi:hypothetical protein
LNPVHALILERLDRAAGFFIEGLSGGNYAAARASEVERTSGPILLRAQASRPDVGYSGKRPASRNGGPSELTQASFASVLGEQGTL